MRRVPLDFCRRFLLVFVDGKDMLIVRPLRPPLQITILLLHDWLEQILQVIDFHLPTELAGDDIIILDDFEPFELSNEETLTLGNRPVLEDGSQVKRCSVCANCVCLRQVVLKSENVPGESVDLVSNLEGAGLEEEHFVHLIQLIVKYNIFLLAQALQVLQDLHHEGPVNLIGPRVEGVPVRTVQARKRENLRE